jgi:hypothetical protein
VSAIHRDCFSFAACFASKVGFKRQRWLQAMPRLMRAHRSRPKCPTQRGRGWHHGFIRVDRCPGGCARCLSSADCEGDLVLRMSDLTAGAQSWHYIEPGGGIECGPQMDLAQQISLQKLLPLLCGNPRFIRTAAFVACAGIRRQLLHVFL